jgi:hypothetical protein
VGGLPAGARAHHPDNSLTVEKDCPLGQFAVRIVDLDLGPTAAQQALRGNENVTVKGTLEYQACNEKECFNPVSVPLSWTMKLRPLIVERPLQPKP